MAGAIAIDPSRPSAMNGTRISIRRRNFMETPFSFPPRTRPNSVADNPELFLTIPSGEAGSRVYSGRDGQHNPWEVRRVTGLSAAAQARAGLPRALVRPRAVAPRVRAGLAVALAQPAPDGPPVPCEPPGDLARPAPGDPRARAGPGARPPRSGVARAR